MHSQQIPAVGDVVTDEIEAGSEAVGARITDATQDVDDTQTESISEQIPSKLEYSTDSDDGGKYRLKVEGEQEKVSVNSLTNAPIPNSPVSENPASQDLSKLSTSWPLDVNAVSDVHISEESPVNLVSDISKEATQDNKSQTISPKLNPHNSHTETPRSSDYLDSLESTQKSEVSHELADNSAKSSNNDESLNVDTSGSEEIIKLDIRGQGAPKFPSTKIIFGPPPEGSTVFEPNMKPIPVFSNLLSPFLVGADDSVKLGDVFNVSAEDAVMENLDNVYEETSLDKIDSSPEESLKESQSDKNEEDFNNSPKESVIDKIEQSDLLVEEISVDEDIKEIENPEESLPPKSIPPEETMSFSTMTTDYKTICEEYHAKVLSVSVVCCISLVYISLLSIQILLVTSMVCYILTHYRLHFIIHKKLSTYFSF